MQIIIYPDYKVYRTNRGYRNCTGDIIHLLREPDRGKRVVIKGSGKYRFYRSESGIYYVYDNATYNEYGEDVYLPLSLEYLGSIIIPESIL